MVLKGVWSSGVILALSVRAPNFNSLGSHFVMSGLTRAFGLVA